MKQIPILAYITFLSPIIPILFGVLKFKVINREMKVLLLLIFTGFIVDFCSMILFLGTKIMPCLVQIFVPIEFLLVMLIISSWQESKKMVKILKIIILFYLFLWLFAKITFEPFESTYYFTGSLSNVIIILSSGYTLLIVIGNRLHPLSKDNRFWVIISFLLYFLGMLMPVALQNILLNISTDTLTIAWYLTWVLSIISQILYSIGFLCPQTQS